MRADDHALDGDEARRAAYARLVVAHLPAAWRLARYLLGDASAAQDCVQSAAERAWRHIHSARADSGAAWFSRIVRNQAMTMIATRPRDQVLEEAHEAIADPAANPEQALAARQEHMGLRTALQQLPAHLRDCLILRELAELSYREIAAVLDIPQGTVMSRLWSARRALLAATMGLRT